MKRAIAAPLPPLKPALPWQLCISLKLKPQFSSPEIKTFLDCLPKPFHWRFETAEERDNLADGIEEKNKQESEILLETAAQRKSEGNAAFAKKDEAAAIKAYGDAIECAVDALAQNAEENTTKATLAILHANRAAAYLLPGKDESTQKALKDGDMAELYDPCYAKS